MADLVTVSQAVRFSPRNGEIILKLKLNVDKLTNTGFSPRNGEIILKLEINFQIYLRMGFSPRNGEIILKGTP